MLILSRLGKSLHGICFLRTSLPNEVDIHCPERLLLFLILYPDDEATMLIIVIRRPVSREKWRSGCRDVKRKQTMRRLRTTTKKNVSVW
jgi:hypothetical protein